MHILPEKHQLCKIWFPFPPQAPSWLKYVVQELFYLFALLSATLSEFCQVLSDPEKRAIYDQYGEEGLKGMPPPGSQSRTATASGSSGPSNFRYNPSDPDDIFNEFMASNKPYTFDQDRRRFQPAHRTSAVNGRSEASSSSQKEPGTSTSHLEKPPPVEKTLLCTLEELYNGTKRKMKITRNVAKSDGYVSTFLIYTCMFRWASV